MTTATEKTIGQWAAEFPLATRVFARHKLDYCCGGGRPLAEVCAEHGLAVDAVVDEIRAEHERPAGDTTRWDEAPLTELVDFILAGYHKPLKEELPRLEGMARKVHAVHRDKAPAMLGELLDVYLGLKAELDAHLLKEEEILFPMVRGGQGCMAEGPIGMMNEEHVTAGAALQRLRELTGDYTVPEGACNTWRALWHGLAALETSLHEHIHLENNILFPRALQSS